MKWEESGEVVRPIKISKEKYVVLENVQSPMGHQKMKMLRNEWYEGVLFTFFLEYTFSILPRYILSHKKCVA